MNNNKVLTESQVIQIAQETGVYGWQAYSYLAVFNKLIWVASEANSITENVSKGRFVLKGGALAIASKPLSFRCPLTWLSEQVKECFPGASHSRDTIRSIVRTMQEWGILEMVDEKSRRDLFILDPKYGFKSPPKLFIKFDLVKAVLYYEKIHQIFSARNEVDKDMGRKFITVPKHNGGFVRRLYEGLLKIRYRIFGSRFDKDESHEDLDVDKQNQSRMGAITSSIAASLGNIAQYKRIMGDAWESSAIVQSELAHITKQQGISAMIRASIDFSGQVLT
jgi:hypothetical protein